MKKNQLKEIRSKSVKELFPLIRDLRKEISKIIVEGNSQGVKKTSLVRNKKKDIACILTIIREKELSNL